MSLLHDAQDNEGEADALHSLATLARRDGDYYYDHYRYNNAYYGGNGKG